VVTFLDGRGRKLIFVSLVEPCNWVTVDIKSHLFSKYVGTPEGDFYQIWKDVLIIVVVSGELLEPVASDLFNETWTQRRTDSILVVKGQGHDSTISWMWVETCLVGGGIGPQGGISSFLFSWDFNGDFRDHLITTSKAMLSVLAIYIF